MTSEGLCVVPTLGQSICISWPPAPRKDTLATPSALTSFVTLTTSLQKVSCFAAVRKCRHLPGGDRADVCARPLVLHNCKPPRVFASIVSESRRAQP